MASSHVKHQFKQDTLPKGNFQHGTNGTVSHKVDKSNSDRTERRKEWWNKKKKSNLESTEGSTMEKTTPGVISLEIGKEKSYESQAQRPKLRNRETISKPDSLKYEPDFNRGFHNKIMQNLFTDTSKKKKNKQHKELNESLTKSVKRKPTSPLAITEPVNAKKIKNDSADINEVFDSYKFSMKLINGDVDVSKNAAGKDSKNKYVLFIGNLPFDITREQLEEHFRKTGGIKSIRIPKEKHTDKGRGFAYMEFESRISHGIALRLHQTTLGGRKINVEFTSIGGGKSEKRKEKLKIKNQKRKKMKMN
uniref:RRM domain-containing protein n=2 Tax=Arion vulgaris TaxID=1028688 RepID=A0A0B6Z6H9_9EUPU